MNKTKKTICEIKFRRQDGDQFLFIKTVEEIEKLFKTDATKQSSIYFNSQNEGLKFYEVANKLNDYIKKYNMDKSFVQRVDLTSYGVDFFLEHGSNYNNLSILRTVGISKGIEVKVNQLIVDNEVQQWISALAKFVKYIYSNFIEKSEIKATIELEF